MNTRSSRIRARHRAPVLVGVAALLSLATSAVALGGGGRPILHGLGRAWHVTYTDQGPPPPGALTPLMMAKFMRLLDTYRSHGAAGSFSFAQWLAMNGVSDEREFWCLMWLWSVWHAPVGHG